MVVEEDMDEDDDGRRVVAKGMLGIPLDLAPDDGMETSSVLEEEEGGGFIRLEVNMMME